MRNKRQLLVLLVIFFSLDAPVWAASFEAELEQRWTGTWVVIRPEVFSHCHDDDYSMQSPIDGEVKSAGARRFAAGELAQVQGLDQKRSSLRVELDLAVPILVPIEKGPFVLQFERSCRVAFELTVPRKAMRQRDLETVEAPIYQVLERFRGEQEARASALWNGRDEPAYPAGYEATLVEYRAWLNVWIDENLPAARELALRSVPPYASDEAYILFFAAGVLEMQENDPGSGSCEDLGGVSIGPSAGADGYDDGRVLAFALATLTRMRECRDPPQEGVDEPLRQ